MVADPPDCTHLSFNSSAINSRAQKCCKFAAASLGRRGRWPDACPWHRIEAAATPPPLLQLYKDRARGREGLTNAILFYTLRLRSLTLHSQTLSRSVCTEQTARSTIYTRNQSTSGNRRMHSHRMLLASAREEKGISRRNSYLSYLFCHLKVK